MVMTTVLLRLLAIAEVAGSAALLVEMLPAWWNVLHAGPGWGKALLVTSVMLAVALFTGVAGMLLWTLRPRGVQLSILAHLLQVPYLALPTYSYRLLLGYAGIVAMNPQTYFVELQGLLASIEVGLGPLTTEEPRIGVNLLAVAICACLWRALRRQRLEADARARGITLPPPAPPLRQLGGALRKTLWMAGLVVGVPAVALWLYNQFDEEPTPQAHRWFAPLVHSVPDRDNAWLALLGIGAAEGDDPITFGRRRVQAYEQRLATRGAHQPGAEELALKEDPLPIGHLATPGDPAEPFCDDGCRDCLAWAQVHADALTRLEAANATRLRRFDQLLALPAYANVSTPSYGSPDPSFGDDRLYRALIQRDLGQPSTRAQALDRLARVVAFWRGALASTHDLLSRRLVLRILERYLRLLDALLDRGPLFEHAALHAAAGTLLREPTPDERRWEPVLRRELLASHHLLQGLLPRNAVAAWRDCAKDCLARWARAQLYAPQATRNLEARLRDAILAVYVAAPRDLPGARERVSKFIEEIEPFPAAQKDLLQRVSYNLMGRSWVVMGQRDYDKHLHVQQDVEGLRRIVTLKRTALQQRLTPAQMRRFLATQPEGLRDPYTGEPFEWHAASGTVRFAARSPVWERSHLTVAYAGPPGR